MRVKAIRLSWFRGAAAPVSMEPNSKSMVVYGANASGKSSFVDAIEYLLHGGKIRHFAHEYSGKHLQHAVPNTHKPADQTTGLSVEFQDGSDINIEINDGGSSNSSGSMLAAITTWDYGRTVLRQDNLAGFIQDTKGGKYSVLLPLLGLHQMEIAAENLRQLAKNVESLSNIAQTRSDLNRIDTKRRAAFGVISDNEILSKVKKLHEKYGDRPAAKKDGLGLCADVISTIEARTARLSTDHGRYITLQDVATLDIKSPVDGIRTASVKLAGDLDPLIVQRLAVLQPSETLIGKLTYSGEVKCPACGQLIQVDAFRAHVKAELERLKEIRKTLGERNSSMGNLCDVVKLLKSSLDKPELKSWRSELTSGPLAEKLSYLDSLDADSLRATCSEKDLQDIESKLVLLVEASALASAEAPPDAKQLRDDNGVAETAKDTIKAGERAKSLERADALVVLLKSLEQTTREEIRRRSNAAIAEISEDVRAMWTILHPHEAIENIHLYVPDDADKAIDISLKFHGKELNSPRLTLSKGYRNSLGLCIFLAMAKREAKSDRPIFLDDVVVSMDRNHRGMIVELLTKEFGARQVIILTHDRDWYTELRQLLDDGTWTFNTLLPYETPEIGIRWSHAMLTFDDARAQLAARPDAAGTDARKIMDVKLTYVGEHLKIRLPYLRLDKNDRRTAHEFLERLVADGGRCFQKRTTEGNYEIHNDAIEALKSADKLLRAWANRGTHSFDLVRSEAAKLIEECDRALEYFRCVSCRKPVWAAEADSPKSHQCQCGHLRWRHD